MRRVIRILTSGQRPQERLLARAFSARQSGYYSGVRSPWHFLRVLADQGVGPNRLAPLAKRVRLTNVMGLFGVTLLLGSLPFDATVAPRWMLVEDVAGAAAFLAIPFLNRAGRHVLSRLLCLTLANLIVLGNAVFLGHESGCQMVFFALAAMPFALFDLSERRFLFTGTGLAVACLALAESGLLAVFQDHDPGFVPAHYYIYSLVVTLLALVYSLWHTARANADMERALRDAREHQVQAEKMAALGQMSSGIAHEINNPLSAILLRVETMRRRAAGTASEGEVADGATKIEMLVVRIQKIVDALRSFARGDDSDAPRTASVRAIVHETIELSAARFRRNEVALRIGPIDEQLSVSCRRVQISQILLNLLSNAFDAVEDAPEGWVSLDVEDLPSEIRISVTDSGPGVPPELRARVMEPFFTTKEVGKGSGLGLSISQGFAHAHGGTLLLDPDTTRTRFVLTLPKTVSRADTHLPTDARV